MRVVHIGYKYGLNNTGGAAIASTRLHQALLANGVESHYVCIWKCEEGENVHELPVGWRRKLFLALTKLTRGLWKFTPYRRSIPLNHIPLFGLERLLRELDPDVVHVQWINADVARFEQLGRLRLILKPTCKVVFNLHDLFLILPEGGHPVEDRYITGLTASNSTRLERWLLARKKQMIDMVKPEFIGPSKWVCDQCGKSIVGRGYAAHAISNLIDPIFTFHPEKCGPHDKFVVLFGCFGGRRNRWKGWEDLKAALKLLPQDVASRTEVRVFGETGPDEVINGISVKAIGAINDPRQMVEIYHQADVFAFPSVRETQGMTKVEAMLCGLPVLAFDRTACAEGIVHDKTGWVADDGNTRRFADGIAWWFDFWRAGVLQEMRPVISNEAHSRFGAIESVGQIKAVYGLNVE